MTTKTTTHDSSQGHGSTMKAYRVPEPGGPEKLQLTEIPVPSIDTDEVLIKVAAIGLNRADISQRQGHYPPPPGVSDVLGLEVSGTIAESKSPAFKEGDEVCALLAGGGYAEYVAVNAAQVLPIPAGVSIVDAAAIPEAAATVWTNVFLHGHLSPGETLLVHGGTSGVGSHAIGIAKYYGATVAATAGSDEKVAYCKELGADIAINYKKENFAEVLNNKVDVVLDVVGAPYLLPNLQTLKTYGRIMIIAVQGGYETNLNLYAVLAKRASITATTLRARELDGPYGKAAIIADVKEHVWPAYESGDIKPIVGSVFPFDQAAKAHEKLEHQDNTGKVLLVF